MKAAHPSAAQLRRDEAAARGGPPPSTALGRRAERRRQPKLRNSIPHRTGAPLGFCAIELASGMSSMI
jgi:hypothetical protein